MTETAEAPRADTAASPQAEPHRHHHHCLVDGSGFIFRAFHALPPMTRPDGTPVNAVFGFCNMLLKLLRESECDGVAVIFDTARATFRSDIYPDYKAHRPPPPEELVPQFPLIREATRAFGLPSIEIDGFEADDLIAAYAKAARARGDQVTIVSSDKDLMQLVGDGVSMLDPIKMRTIGMEEVREKFGVGPEKMVDLQALIGDPTDNVPGIPGIGPKTAATLLEEYGDLDTLLARAEEIKQPKRRQAILDSVEVVRLSKQLVKLDDEAPMPVPLDDFPRREPDPTVLRAFLVEQGFKQLLARVSQDPVEAAAELTSEKHEASYELVQDVETLKRWIDHATAVGRVAVDTETTSLNAMQAELCGVSLCVEAGTACYIPLGHKVATDLVTTGELRQIPMDQALDLLRPMLENPAVLKVGQNLKYDMTVLARAPYDIRIAPIDDTMLMSYALDAGRHGHGMDELSELHLGHKPVSYTEVAGKGKAQISFAEVGLEKARDYAAEDADVTLRLAEVLKPRLVAERMMTVYETLERPLVPVLLDMELKGIKVDRNELARLSLDFAERMAVLEAEIHRLAGRPFSIASPKQLGEVLFEDMGLQGGKKGKTGAYGTGADVLEQLAAQGHDLPARVLEWRQLAKLKSTYTDTLVEEIHPVTGRVHTSFALGATNTGRLSSSDPNLQNIPIRTEEGRKIRRAFVAEPGHKLLSADYSQIELRLLAHIADIEALKSAFREGIDIHALTASQVFGVPIEGMDPMVRRSAKAINFGIVYGMSAFGLAQQLGVPQREAAAYIDAYFKRYPGIRDYVEETKKECRVQGFVRTVYGRKVHLEGINDKNPARRNFAERRAINAPIQGSAADIIRRAMIRMPAALTDAGLDTKMLLQVHDELVFEAPEAEVEQAKAVVKRVMEAAPGPARQLSVPLTVETGAADNWAEAH
ncbi:MAG: DNA polymerase I [Rhodospirillaceae bacterium]|nr:DNA polymerase I [Rhodospirillaceae bacterium]